MLPSELGRFKVVGDKVLPLFATEEDKDVAEEVIGLFTVGKKFGEIQEEEKMLEKAYSRNSNEVKLVRGLFKLMARKVTLSGKSDVEPVLIRRDVFSRGPALTKEEREKILREVSQKLGVNAEENLYADLDSEKVVSSVQQTSPIQLIKEYNLSLLQTLLFRCYKLTVEVQDNWKEIVRRIKLLGLMYTAYSDPVRIEVVGPATLLKLTEKYGRNMAVLLPYIVASRSWKISAEVVLGKKKKRVYTMEVSSFPLIDSNTALYESEFDSSVEEKFFKDFVSSIKDWKLKREPSALVVKDRLFIPDFSATKGNLEVYIEIVGFWTKNYVREKLEKLREVKVPILVLLNSELSKEDFNGFEVIKFKGKVNVAEVYKWLKEYERKNANYNVTFTLDKDVVSLEEISKSLNVPLDVVRKNAKPVVGYTLLRNYYVKNELLERLKTKDFQGRRLNDLVSEYGSYIVEVLEYLGYRLKWLNITDAIVQR
ncbi:MAG: hypothetical protein ASUL_06774 [Candidatus Aramenus sulfurataquae]|uniref:DUF790 family protein n=1 Tax=Candidatus Aramenus sulfurataquae TaxID=1326980 RepID=W7KUD7_9CREN|nr:MAG: hypothetical protein ASUL_06774 [Candidatus Aramenus sulfurataquae]